MEHFHRVARVFWSPSAALADAASRPFVLAPLLVPTVFASSTSLILFFKFDPVSEAVRGAAYLGLAAAAIGPVLVVFAVATLLFGVFSAVGRRRGYRAFLSVTALAFVPTALSHLAQGVIVLLSPAGQPPSAQAGRLNLTYFMDPATASPGAYAAAATIDVVSLWVLGLMVLGYGNLGPGSRRVSAAVVIGAWLAYAVLRIALAGITPV